MADRVPPNVIFGAQDGNSSSGTSILGRSRPTCDLRAEVRKIALRSSTVLIEGETGVGKEVAAREIHALSPRRHRPFVPVDCTAFSSQLIESQLFGHIKGAFTGAVASSQGFLRCADGGAVFLDEIGELPLPVQGKLLRCIQERAVVPVGSTEPIPSDVRFLSATHRNLAEMVEAGQFREDLYYRLNVVRLGILPLRERRDDILPLAAHFLDELASFYEEPVKRLATAVEDRLLQYHWPGNVRQLRNAMERAMLYCPERTIELGHLPPEIRASTELAEVNGTTSSTAESTSPEQLDDIPPLADAERMLIARALKATRGNQSHAARLLDVERHRLRRMISRHGLQHLLSGNE